MRHLISGMVAAVAVMAAAPAMACGYGHGGYGYASPCAQAYVAPVTAYGYGGCHTGCGGWATERLADPVQQYYYVNQGPVYSGHGNWAPVPTYQESAVSGWGAYQDRPYYYGYNGGRYANATNHYYDGVGVEGPRVYRYSGYSGYRAYRPWRPRVGYYHRPRMSYRYGYAPRHAYAPRYAPAPYHYGRPLRRYY